MTTNVKVGISLGSAGLALALGSVARYAWLGWHGIVPMHGGVRKSAASDHSVPVDRCSASMVCPRAVLTPREQRRRL